MVGFPLDWDVPLFVLAVPSKEKRMAEQELTNHDVYQLILYGGVCDDGATRTLEMRFWEPDDKEKLPQVMLAQCKNGEMLHIPIWAMGVPEIGQWLVFDSKEGIDHDEWTLIAGDSAGQQCIAENTYVSSHSGKQFRLRFLQRHGGGYLSPMYVGTFLADRYLGKGALMLTDKRPKDWQLQDIKTNVGTGRPSDAELLKRLTCGEYK